MSEQSLNLLLNLLTETKKVWIADFNIQQFVTFARKRGLNPLGGALTFDEDKQYDG